MLRISFNELGTKVLGNLAESTLELTTQTGDQTIINHPLVVEVKNNFVQYDAVIIKNTFSGMGENLATTDLLRSNIDASIKKIITGFAAFKGLPTGEDAQQLLNIYTETGSTYQKSYADKTVILNKRIEKLALPENKARISRLGFTTQVTQLEDAQTAFSKLNIDQAQANSVLRQQSSATATREYMEEALRNYYGLVNAMRNVAPWDKLYAALAEVVKSAKLSSRPNKDDKNPQGEAGK
jgi:hypothetical protein